MIVDSYFSSELHLSQKWGPLSSCCSWSACRSCSCSWTGMFTGSKSQLRFGTSEIPDSTETQHEAATFIKICWWGQFWIWSYYVTCSSGLMLHIVNKKIATDFGTFGNFKTFVLFYINDKIGCCISWYMDSALFKSLNKRTHITHYTTCKGFDGLRSKW